MIGGGIACFVTTFFDKYLPRYNDNLALGFTSFLPAIFITAVKHKVPSINASIAILSSVAVPLPGYGISLGLAELANNSVLRGMGRLISGLVTLLWLVVGGWLGALLVEAITTVTSENPTPVHKAWLALAIPVLAIGLNVGFQIGKFDFVPAFCLCILAYLVIFGTSYIGNSNISNFLSTAITTICANLYCNYRDRPQPIILIPAIVFLVSGSIGFRGLTQVFAAPGEDADAEGWSQFGQMFLVAVLIMVGILVGDSIVLPKTTL